LAEVLPVKLRERNDLNLRNVNKDVRVLENGWTDAGLKQVGIGAFNETEVKDGSRQVMRIGEWPLLVTGVHGQGRTVAFMGFTPNAKELDIGWLGLYGQMLMAARGENPEYRYANVAAIDKPLMQLLKEQPRAHVTIVPQSLHVSVRDKAGHGSLELQNGDRFARLVRVRAEWKGEASRPPVVLYSGNYIDLLPRERQAIEIDFRLPAVPTRPINGTIVVEGTNVEEKRIPIELRAEQ
jgi:hypothetical protein